jgi:peptidyl-tRNA hydrolase
MNLSSQSLEALLKTYTNASLENSMLVVDDLDHKPGYASIKKTGSAE